MALRGARAALSSRGWVLGAWCCFGCAVVAAGRFVAGCFEADCFVAAGAAAHVCGADCRAHCDYVYVHCSRRLISYCCKRRAPARMIACLPAPPRAWPHCVGAHSARLGCERVTCARRSLDEMGVHGLYSICCARTPLLYANIRTRCIDGAIVDAMQADVGAQQITRPASASFGPETYSGYDARLH